MAFNIYAHIIDHAHFLIDDLVCKDQKLVHFNTSVDASYFMRNGYVTQEDIDEIMVEILKNISKKEIIVREKNGTYSSKNGQKKQKYRTRKIVFSSVLAAYHSKHFDASKSVMPHFHFLLGIDARVGKDFMYLKQGLREEAQKYGIKFNFMEEKQDTGLSKKQMQSIKRMSWHMNQGKLEKIKTYFSKPNQLKNTLDLVVKHYEHTENLSFFLKTLLVVNERLNELDIDYVYKGTNLKENILFFLSESQQYKVKALQQGRVLPLELTQVLDREILKYTHGFKSEVMNILMDKFSIGHIENTQITYSEYETKKTSVKTKSKTSFRDLVKKDIRSALAQASSEKEWKTILQGMGYSKASIKTVKNNDGKREKVGITIVTNKKTKMVMMFSELRLNQSKITAILMFNNRRKKEQKKIESHIVNYKKKENFVESSFTKYEYRIRVLLKLYSPDIANPIATDSVNELAQKYNVYRSDMYNITTLESDDVTIVDSGKELVLKKSEEIPDVNAISDMLDLALLKGWDLENIEVTGSDVFVQETQKQIDARSKPNTDKPRRKHKRR